MSYPMLKRLSIVVRFLMVCEAIAAQPLTSSTERYRPFHFSPPDNWIHGRRARYERIRSHRRVPDGGHLHWTPPGRQTQNIAYSSDRGRTWKRYAGNPVNRPSVVEADFRDPMVFCHEPSRRWIMVVGPGCPRSCPQLGAPQFLSATCWRFTSPA